jgi:RimJ/RimL family protein N-acetyltransferase
MSLVLRSTHKTDLPFVFKTEQKASRDGFVGLESLADHEKFLADEDIRHLIIETERRPVGYVILAGLKDVHENIELKRIVVAEKGMGFGRKAVQMVKKMAFEELNANRLWLDVFDSNDRARRLYESEGFMVEGVWRKSVKSEDGRKSLVFMSILKDEYRKNE